MAKPYRPLALIFPHGPEPFHFRHGAMEGNSTNGVPRHLWRTPPTHHVIPGMGHMSNLIQPVGSSQPVGPPKTGTGTGVPKTPVPHYTGSGGAPIAPPPKHRRRRRHRRVEHPRTRHYR